MRWSLLPLIILLMAVPACDMLGPPPTATRTPRPTITPTRTVAPVAGEADTIVAPTAASATATPTLPALGSSPTPTETAIETPTPIDKAGAPQPTPQPLTITNVLIIGIERDSLRDQGAIVSVQVVYSGGRAPYIIYHDDTEQRDNPFKVLAVCDGAIVHTVRLVSGDRQTIVKKYYFSPIACPP